METKAALIVRGDAYSSLEELKGRFDHKKLVQEIEGIFQVNFSRKYFFNKNTNKHKILLNSNSIETCSSEPHFNDGLFGEKALDDTDHCFQGEDGLDVAMGTKIIELAYGLGGEIVYDLIIVVTNCSSVLKAIECADGKKCGLVKVIGSSPATAAKELYHFFWINNDTSKAIYLDDLVKNCLLDPQKSVQQQSVISPTESAISSLASTSPILVTLNSVPKVTDEFLTSKSNEYPAVDGNTET